MTKALHLFQAVGNIQNTTASRSQPFYSDEQLIRLLRCQHGSRLIHDQQARFLQQTTHDLDALALTHGQISHQGIGPQGQAVVIGHLFDAPGHIRNACVPRQG